MFVLFSLYAYLLPQPETELLDKCLCKNKHDTFQYIFITLDQFLSKTR